MRIVLWVSFFLLASWLRADDYADPYGRGSLAISLGNCEEGEPLLQEALKGKPKGDFRKNYFPHYYLAICALKRSELEEAQKLAKQAEGSGISFSSLAKEYSKFKHQLQAKLKEPRDKKVVLAVAVNSANAVENISMVDLRKIFKGEKKAWDSGIPIVPVLGPAGSDENRAFLSVVCGLNERELDSVWKSQQMTPLQRIEKKEWIVRFVFTNPGAIAFYPASTVSQQVKVISVEGKSQQDPEYPMRIQ